MTDAHGKVPSPAEAAVPIAGGATLAATGLVNISQNAESVAFLGTFTSGGPDMKIDDGLVHILQDSRQAKFVGHGELMTFSGRAACAGSRRICDATGRTVFEPTDTGLCPTEIASGVDRQRDIPDRMAFPQPCPAT